MLFWGCALQSLAHPTLVQFSPTPQELSLVLSKNMVRIIKDISNSTHDPSFCHFPSATYPLPRRDIFSNHLSSSLQLRVPVPQLQTRHNNLHGRRKNLRVSRVRSRFLRVASTTGLLCCCFCAIRLSVRVLRSGQVRMVLVVGVERSGHAVPAVRCSPAPGCVSASFCGARSKSGA